MGDFQCLNIILATVAIPTIRTEYALFVRFDDSVLSPKRHSLGDIGRVTPAHVPKNSSMFFQNGFIIEQSHIRYKKIKISFFFFYISKMHWYVLVLSSKAWLVSIM